MHTKTQQIKDLTEQNEALENYFRNTIIPQFFIDAGLILRKFTPAAMKQFKLTENDIGKSVNDIQDKFSFENISADIQQVIQSNTILEKEICTTDLRWYQMNILPYIILKNNKINGVIVTFIEITQRIKDLKEQENLVTEIELLLDTISHDVKSPIANVSTAIELIKEIPRENAEEFQELLHALENSVAKVVNLVNELTNTRKQEHKYVAKQELLEFEMILEDVLLLLHTDIKKSGAIIKTDIQAHQLNFSRRNLRSIVYNLVCNAVKYKSPERSLEILVKTENKNGLFLLYITDNGVGIDNSNLEVIFSKYFRLENGIEGSGIGLFLVKEFVTNAGGKIEVKSELGKGTEFKIFLQNK